MTRARPLIVAAFEPFGGRARNRSWEVVRRLEPRRDLEIVQLPVDFARLRTLVPDLIRRRPRALLMVGEAPASRVAVEQVALNVIDSERPDNRGARHQATAIVKSAPLALEAPWDAHVLARRLNERGVAASVSFHAGTYACNTALYLALHAAAGRLPVGFLHVPYRRGPGGVPMARLVRAVEMAVDAIAETRAPHVVRRP
jgi:pyroglutamyl-peptidase